MGGTSTAISKTSEAVTAVVNLVRDAWGVDVKKEREIAKAKADAIDIVSKAEIQAENEKLIARVKQRLFIQEINRQSNLESVLSKSIPLLTDGVSPDNLDQGFLHRFSIAAQDVNEKELQEMFARALAQEARQAKTVSNRTLDIMHSMSKGDAQLVQRLASLVFKVGFTPAVIVPNEMRNQPILYGLAYEQLLHLDEIGILNHKDLVMKVHPQSNYGFAYFGKQIIKRNPKDSEIKISVHTLTWDGISIVRVAGGEPNEKYFDAIMKYLEDLGFEDVNTEQDTQDNKSDIQDAPARLG